MVDPNDSYLVRTTPTGRVICRARLPTGVGRVGSSPGSNYQNDRVASTTRYATRVAT